VRKGGGGFWVVVVHEGRGPPHSLRRTSPALRPPLSLDPSLGGGVSFDAPGPSRVAKQGPNLFLRTVPNSRSYLEAKKTSSREGTPGEGRGGIWEAVM